MSYPTDTILTRRDTEGDAFDKLKVVGPSPIRTAVGGQWGGLGGESLIVHPIGEVDGEEAFVAPEIVPIQALAEQYEIEYEPDPAPTHLESQRPPRAVRQLSPEEQFRAEAKREKSSDTSRDKTGRKRTPIGDAEE